MREEREKPTEKPKSEKPATAYYVASVKNLEQFLAQKAITNPRTQALQKRRSNSEQQRRLKNIKALEEVRAALSKYDEHDYAHMLTHPDGTFLLLSSFPKDVALREALSKIIFPGDVTTLAELEKSPSERDGRWSRFGKSASFALAFHSELASAVARAKRILQASSHSRKAGEFQFRSHPIILEVQRLPGLFDLNAQQTHGEPPQTTRPLVHALQPSVPIQHLTRIHVSKDLPRDSRDNLIALLSAAKLDEVRIKTY